MNIRGLQKTTLLDYPGHVASTIFTAGCNFRCPFCHNGELVLDPGSLEPISEEEVLAHLNKRKNVLDGVCISGGEPTLDPDLTSFLAKVRETGLSIKLDTNGYRPEVLRKVIDEGLVDYVAMDIKAGRDNYADACGLPNIDMANIEEAVEILASSGIVHEFRTTCVKGLHTLADFEDIAAWLPGDSLYFLQDYKEGPTVINPVYESFSVEELEKFVEVLKPAIPATVIRGCD